MLSRGTADTGRGGASERWVQVGGRTLLLGDAEVAREHLAHEILACVLLVAGAFFVDAGVPVQRPAEHVRAVVSEPLPRAGLAARR